MTETWNLAENSETQNLSAQHNEEWVDIVQFVRYVISYSTKDLYKKEKYIYTPY